MNTNKRKLKVLLRIEKRSVAVEYSKELYALLKQCCNKAAELLRLESYFEAGLCLVDDNEMQQLNLRTRGIDNSTDVLSFPLGENGEYDSNPENSRLMLGDIIISVPTAIRQSYDFGHSLDRELCYLLTHGILHLLGYDHISEGDRHNMRALEEGVLASLGLRRG